MTTKPNILYYECLNYNWENLEHLKNVFTVEIIPDPRYDETFSKTMKRQIECIFLPLGFSFGKYQANTYTECKVIASNTTTRPNVDEDVDVEVVWLDDSHFLDSITCTAEHALGLMHSVHRRIPAQNRNVQNNHWNRYDITPPKKMLSKMNAVIWGHGRVGRHLSIRARPLFNNITYIEEGNTDEWINARLSKADVLFLTLSVVGEQPVVTKDRLDCLPEHATVINVSRGEVLDHEHLLFLLHQERIDGAGLDVLPRDHAYTYGEMDPVYEKVKEYMKNHTNLIVTPHIAGSTEDAWNNTQRYVIEKVKEILL
jgi:D-3-phosphoglycerate dehydrogenase